ncbi:tumor necrosis factor receptor superfamily member 14-like [Salminus brasiliensis]|uniref:tumor necrosis factor receptor superfamily member 14-like n=1 Tax=Salminus brasiliensis TaxID=930266 RepID=UPI003B82E991
MISSLYTIIVTAALLSLKCELCFSACARAEYEINGECCPMCAPGNRVFKHCTKDTSTTCVPCVGSYYTAEPNGLIKCLECRVCDPVQGLRVKTACTPFSNTVCEPREGFYCTDHNTDNCTEVEEHRTCSPGQYIKQRGTAVTNTECAGCADGTYSNGSLHVCQPHSKCEEMGLAEIRPGTTSSDVECGKKTGITVSVGLVVGVAVVAVAAAAIVFFKMKYKTFQHPAGNELTIRSEDPALISLRTNLKKTGTVRDTCVDLTPHILDLHLTPNILDTSSSRHSPRVEDCGPSKPAQHVMLTASSPEL